MGDELAKYIAGDISDIELHRRVVPSGAQKAFGSSEKV